MGERAKRSLSPKTSPLEALSRYPTLRLGDVYASIAFYFNHQEDVEAYRQQRQQQAQEIRHMNEARFNLQDLRDR